VNASDIAPDRSGAVDAELVSGLRLASMRLSRRLRRESGDDITPSQLAVLGTVERYGPLTLGGIAEIEGVQPPTVTRIVGWLSEQGLVTLKASTTDKRAKTVVITSKGTKRLQRIRSNRNAWLATRMATLSPAERGRIEAALPVIEKIMGDQP
jgi:DNA-binding MarR family transcriptional regulator